MASSKKAERLKQRAVATVRAPKPASLLEPPRPRRRYRVVAVSLYTQELEMLDRLTALLRMAGHAQASRSLVVREAIHRLDEGVGKLRPQDLVREFLERQARAASGSR